MTTLHRRKSGGAVMRFLLIPVIVISCFCAVVRHADAEPMRLFVCNLLNNSVEVFGRTGAFKAVFVSPGSGGLNQPQNLTKGPDGNLYVTSWGTSSVKRYDGTTGAYIDDFVRSGSGGLANPDQLLFREGKLYVSSRFNGTISRYDSDTGRFIDTFVSYGGLSGFTAFTFGPDGNVYAGQFNFDHNILIFSGVTGRFIGRFNHGNTPIDAAVTGLVFGPDGNLYACRWIANLVERYDGTTGAFIDDFVSAGSGGLQTADYLDFGPDGNLYVAGLDNGAVLRYNGTTGAFIDVFTSGGTAILPKGVLFAPLAR